MWKQLYEWAKQLLMLSQDTERNRADIKDVREELDRLTGVVQRLAFEVQRLGEKIDYGRAAEANEREKLTLKLENEMLKFERRLLTGKSGEDANGKK
jgi:predicted  nucleic acid-binding Zn-ribbon protein